MDKARKQLQLDSLKAEDFKHYGIRGDERASSLAEFFREHLPTRYGVERGEATDHRDTRTGRLDLVIYDRASCAPIWTGAENLLLPCEALFCVVEVKTTITQDELNKALVAAGKVRSLRPFKKPFIAARQDGTGSDLDRDRCMYVIFGHTSNLANDSQWLEKEYRRLDSAAASANVSVDCVDRLIVLDRGIINPQKPTGKWEEGSADSIFLEAYLQVINFLGRESARRQPVDWQAYGPRSSSGWRPIRIAASPR
jgi:hypothetical protein